ncbi:DUF3727 domain-containing protein [Gloeocapsa sp. PCC 73106]|uniref:DUF3727 domain-containing protein n=1 Tax=Gloeocapsa sp. PCC 73106 TaxID=102232 RepID=UPI0002AC6E55|nr:DUF3727 domain-containing protein [Gloeocapsa sp. PCC 73106]ELR98539.1 Protein of unknown function (DUF3727) [Gloeocapsa sp. PCC 73106]
MSSSQFSQTNEQDDHDNLTLFDDFGRSLDCYIENSLEYEDSIYLLLLPCNSPVIILSESEENEDPELEETVIIEDESEIEAIFSDAKAVLAELDLLLHNTAFTLTITGELPPLDEENIWNLEIDEEDPLLEQEELQWLASFYSQGQKYNICAPINPILFVARDNQKEGLQLLSSSDPELKEVLNELLLEDLDEE